MYSAAGHRTQSVTDGIDIGDGIQAVPIYPANGLHFPVMYRQGTNEKQTANVCIPLIFSQAMRVLVEHSESLGIVRKDKHGIIQFVQARGHWMVST